MKLPNDSIGISDILQWRLCPARFAHGMRRHSEAVPGETNENNAYGSAIHEAIHLVEVEGLTNEKAIDAVWPQFAGHLDPEDMALLAQDLDCYRGDTPLGMELVAAERDARVPLFLHEGKQVWFRFKIDALYRRVDDRSVFLQRDYKSSKWRKTQKEVDEDLQMWAYNFGVHELYPECAHLIQSYEQLRFGNLPTSKSDAQRKNMRAWLIRTVRSILEDDVLAPTQNEWCPWCPLVVTCDETQRATRYWKGTLSVLAPQTREGRRTKITFGDEGDELEHIIASVMPRMIESRKHMEAVEKALKSLIERMPVEERARLGWRITERKSKGFDAAGLRAIHEALGPQFYEVISLSRSAVEAVVGKAEKGQPLSPQLQSIQEHELERSSSSVLVPSE